MRKLYTAFASAAALMLSAAAGPAGMHAATLDGGYLYGFVTGSSSYMSYTANNFYRFSLDNLSSYEKVGSGFSLDSYFGIATTFSNGKIVGIGGSAMSRQVYSVDFSGDDWNKVTGVSTSGFTTVTDLTDDNGTVYGWFNTSIGQWQLGTIDPATGAMTPIGAATTNRLQGITSDGSGNFYGISTDGNLYSVSGADGSLTKIGSLGVSVSSSTTTSICYDGANGRILWPRYDDSSMFNQATDLYAINPSTGSASSLGRFENAPRIVGVCCPMSYNPSAPGEVTGLTASNDGVSNDIDLTFTIPTVTVNGKEMNENLRGLTYTVTVDGVKVIDAKETTRGAEVSEKITSTPGSHMLTVYVSQTTYGDGPEVKADVYVGADTPGAVKDLTLVADGSDITLSWAAPAGIHGGRYDNAKVSYTVVRMPDNTEVATGLTATTFTETVPAERLTAYSYQVTTVYDGEPTDYSATSNTVFAGPAFSVTRENPFVQDFESCDTADDMDFFWMFESAYGETPEALLGSDADGNKFIKLAPANRANNPRLFTTALRLRARHTYSLSFKYRMVAFYGASFQVDLTDAPQAGANVVRSIVPNNSYGFMDNTYQEWTDEKTITQQFEVEEDGVYFIEITNGYISNEWDFDNFRVEDLTEPGKPMGVTDMTVQPETAGSRRINIGFTLPMTDTNGDAPALTKATLTRGETELCTWTESLTPGTRLTWTDEKAPLALNTYTVVVENAYGQSVAVQATATAGREYDLTLESLDKPASVIRGKDIAITAVILNNGRVKAPANEESFYTVSLVQQMSDGSRTIVGSFNGTPIGPDETAEYTFNVPTGISTPDKLSFYVATVYDADEYPDDNLVSEEFEVDVITPAMPAPEGLAGEYKDGKNMLTWNAPAYDADQVELKGYYVYCNGEKLYDEPVYEPNFSHDVESDRTYVYAVSALYSLGESEKSAELSMTHSGLGTIVAAGVSVNVLDGTINVTGVAGRFVSLFNAAGLCVYSTVADADTLMIRVTPGVYFVAVDGNAVKIAL